MVGHCCAPLFCAAVHLLGLRYYKFVRARRRLQRMNHVLRFPILVFALSLAVLWLSVWIGVFLRKRRRILEEDERQDFGTIMSAILTLLGLIIGFSFSMAIYRYDQRKDLEEAEANAIGTEFVRADFLPASDAAKVRSLLRDYVDQRIAYYATRDDQQLKEIDV